VGQPTAAGSATHGFIIIRGLTQAVVRIVRLQRSSHPRRPPIRIGFLFRRRSVVGIVPRKGVPMAAVGPPHQADPNQRKLPLSSRKCSSDKYLRLTMQIGDRWFRYTSLRPSRASSGGKP
jgi:hypothetical protein